MEFFQTKGGHEFYFGTMPAITKALKEIAAGLTPKKMERQVATTDNVVAYLDAGWAPVLKYNDAGIDCIIMEREVSPK